MIFLRSDDKLKQDRTIVVQSDLAFVFYFLKSIYTVEKKRLLNSFGSIRSESIRKMIFVMAVCWAMFRS